jgi:hypothetical protein
MDVLASTCRAHEIGERPDVHGTGVSDVAFRSEHVRGVLYHRTEVDPDIRYPPYSENQSLHKTAGEMLWSAARVRCACDPRPALEGPGPAPRSWRIAPFAHPIGALSDVHATSSSDVSRSDRLGADPTVTPHHNGHD